MTANAKPATPLPWIDPRTIAASWSVWQGDPEGKQVQVAACRVVDESGNTMPNMVDHDGDCAQNAAYIVTACNAYPQLVADRQELVAALRHAKSCFVSASLVAIEQMHASARNPKALKAADSARMEADRCAAELNAVLAKLGEA